MGSTGRRVFGTFMVNGKPYSSNDLPLSEKYTRISFGDTGSSDKGSLKYQQLPNGNIYIASIVTHPDMRGQGIGSALLNKVFDLADKRGLTVEIFASPTDSSISESQLYQWYENRGFVRQHDNQKWGDTMLRAPKR